MEATFPAEAFPRLIHNITYVVLEEHPLQYAVSTVIRMMRLPTLVGLTSTEGVALSASGLEETSTLLGVTVLETHCDECVCGCSRKTRGEKVLFVVAMVNESVELED